MVLHRRSKGGVVLLVTHYFSCVPLNGWISFDLAALPKVFLEECLQGKVTEQEANKLLYLLR